VIPVKTVQINRKINLLNTKASNCSYVFCFSIPWPHLEEHIDIVSLVVFSLSALFSQIDTDRYGIYIVFRFTVIYKLSRVSAIKPFLDIRVAITIGIFNAVG
jgi:hypothetical protein